MVSLKRATEAVESARSTVNGTMVIAAVALAVALAAVAISLAGKR